MQWQNVKQNHLGVVQTEEFGIKTKFYFFGIGFCSYFQIKDLFLNFVITIGIGVLFIVVFPIIGCTFCCCRVVCGCCCERPQKEDPKSSCKKKVYGSILFTIVTFTFAGNICVFLSNERMTTAIDKITDTVNNNIDDVTTYLTSTIEQVEHIRDNFKATSDVIANELDGTKIAETLSKRAVSVLTNGTISRLQSDIDKANNIMMTIKTDANIIETNMKNIISDISSVCNTCLSPKPSVTISLPSLNLNDNPMDTAIHQLKSEVAKNVPTVTAQINSAKSQITGLNTQINQGVDGMKNAVHNAQGFDVDNTKKQVHDMVDNIKPYDKYRWYGGVGLASIILLVVALQYFGLVFGVIGGCGNGSNQGDKGCLSNSGGRMLIASVALIFIFSSLLMLLTTVLFIPGSMLERFVCQPLADPEANVLDDVLGKFIDVQSIMKYNNPVSLSQIISSCRENKAAYIAFHLEDSTLVPMKMSDIINRVQRAKQNMNLDLALNNLNQIGSVNLPNNAVTNIQQKVKNVDFSKLENSLTKARKSLLSIKHAVTVALINPNPKLQTIKENDLPLMETKIREVEDNTKTLKTLMHEILTISPKVQQSLQEAEKNLKNKGMKSITKGFIDRIFNIIDDFVATTNTSVYKDLGKCEPLWNLYNSVILISVCHYTIDSLNGVWFSIGWCILFFIPSILFSVKFSNLIRDVDDFNQQRGVRSRIASTLSLNKIRTNKVGHVDNEV